MNGSERPAAQADEIMRLHELGDVLVDLLADTVARRFAWQTLMTQIIREKAALQIANDRLREELRRYTSRQVGPEPVSE